MNYAILILLIDKNGKKSKTILRNPPFDVSEIYKRHRDALCLKVVKMDPKFISLVIDKDYFRLEDHRFCCNAQRNIFSDQNKIPSKDREKEMNEMEKYLLCEENWIKEDMDFRRKCSDIWYAMESGVQDDETYSLIDDIASHDLWNDEIAAKTALGEELNAKLALQILDLREEKDANGLEGMTAREFFEKHD